MDFKLCRTTNLDLVRGLHTEVMPADSPHLCIKDGSILWLAKTGESIAGYCSAIETDSCVFLNSAGVLKYYRGRGLHRRLIRVRAAYAKRAGKPCITYTVVGNTASANNLIREGFLTYEPSYAWVGRGVNYWMKGR